MPSFASSRKGSAAFKDSPVIASPLPGGAPAPQAGPDSNPGPHGQARAWAQVTAGYAKPDGRRSLLQLLLTSAVLIALWAGMALSVEEAYWVTLVLAVPAAGFLVRLFMIQHDCGHRAYFRSAGLNDWIGRAISVLTLTPHDYWRKTHNIHHGTNGHLEKRGVGDVSTLTVREYLAAPRWKRLGYRLYRHPAVFLGVGSLYLFVLKWRFPLDVLRARRDSLISVLATNLAIAALAVGMGLWLGFPELLMIHGPVVLLAAIAGVWLFFVQHQFEETYWRREGGWDFFEAALKGSSFFDLPRPLRWLTASIGIHHIHHLSSRIPNYRLYECLQDHPELRNVTRVSLRESLKCFRFTLWDEEKERLVSFGSLRAGATA